MSRGAVPESEGGGIVLALDAVVIAVTEESPRLLIVDQGGADTLPSGTLDPEQHPTLERGLRDWVARQTSIELGYVEQLYTFGDRLRDRREPAGPGRQISAAYLALVGEREPLAAARWRDVYQFLPWEDWRRGRPELFDTELAPSLLAWARGNRQRRQRVELTFGLGGAPFDPERTLERYELLWEAGLVAEAGEEPGLGRAMARDHRRMVATALGRLRGKLRYRPVVFELLAPTFTLRQLQRTVEALAGSRLHTQNFRRLVEQGGLVEGTGSKSRDTGGRPAELFRFRHEVFRERPAPGVYFPGAWWSR